MEGHKRPVRRPGRRAGVAASRDQPAHVGAIRRHDVNLRSTAAVGDKRDLVPRFRVPGRGDVHAGREGQALQVLPVGVDKVNLRVAAHAGAEGEPLAIGRPRRRGIQSFEAREGNAAVGFEREDENVRVAQRISGESQARIVRGPARRRAVDPVTGDGMLVKAVVIHHPDFRVTGPVADESDFGEVDAGDSTPESLDDLVGEAVCRLSSGNLVQRGHVPLGEDARVRRVLDVVKTPRDHQVFVDDFGLAKSQHLGGSGRVCPALEIHVSGLDGDFEGKVALADHLKDARIAQVVP